MSDFSTYQLHHPSPIIHSFLSLEKLLTEAELRQRKAANVLKAINPSEQHVVVPLRSQLQHSA
jgi:hypothetical protein